MSELVDKLVDAAENGDVGKVRELINDGADINAQNQYGEIALIKATLEEHSDVVRLLIQNRVNVNARSSSKPELDIVGGETALYWASGNQYPEIIKMLLDAGADPNIKNLDGEGPTNFEFFNNIYDARASVGSKKKSKSKSKHKKKSKKSKKSKKKSKKIKKQKKSKNKSR